MRFQILTRSFVSLTAATALCLCAPPTEAADYHVTVNTSALVSNSNAPFALDFTLIGGNALSNVALLKNFTFSLGGAVTANPPATLTGNAAGNLSSTVSLSDSAASFYNEFYQGFTPGSTLQFDLSLTTNVNGPSPDSFAFAILDKNLLNLPTNGPGDVLMTIDLNGPVPTVQTFTTADGISVSVAAVPEPHAALLLGIGMLGAVGFIRRRRLNLPC